jgi:hypothetical protein
VKKLCMWVSPLLTFSVRNFSFFFFSIYFLQLIIIINRIRNFLSNSPLARFNTGLQILRQKISEWNFNAHKENNFKAHKENNFKDLEFEIAELIQKLMKLELQCWRESMNQSFEMFRNKAYHYWFFLYNLIHEFLREIPTAKQNHRLLTSKTLKSVSQATKLSKKNQKSAKSASHRLQKFSNSSSSRQITLNSNSE